MEVALVIKENFMTFIPSPNEPGIDVLVENHVIARFMESYGRTATFCIYTTLSPIDYSSSINSFQTN
jgi:hypothetical protein